MKEWQAAVAALRRRNVAPAPPSDGSHWSLLAVRYAAAAAAVAIAATAHGILAHAIGPIPPFITFYPAVLLVVLFAGSGPGFVSVALSAFAVTYFFLPPIGSLAVAGNPQKIALGVFLFTGAVLCTLAERLRRARWAEKVAAGQMELLRATMSSIGEGVVATDVDGRIMFMNGAAESLIGYAGADAELKPLDAVLLISNAATAEPLTDVSGRVLREGSLAGGVELSLWSHKGRDIPVEVSGVPMRSAEGSVYGVVLTLRDCSGRKQSELAVQRLLNAVQSEKEWLSQVLNSINEEVYFTDNQRRYSFINPAARREFGYTGMEGLEVEKVIAGLSVFRADGSVRPAAESPALRALGGEIIKDEEQIVRTPRSGELRNRQVSAAPVRDAAGNIIGSVAVVRDITDRKRVENALREADRRKNVFLATLSHELRNPLAPIRTAARLLESPLAGAEDLERCRAIISRQVAQMASLLDDLLDVSRFTRGELSLKKAYVPLQQILEAAVEAVQPAITEKHHRLTVEPTPPLMLEVDPVRLTQVVSNLLTNAAKYTDPGGGILLKSLHDAGSLQIQVTDSGIGLEPEMFARVFEMFVQVEPAKEHTEGGLGIGLALVKALVELHGGRIEVRSQGLGMGSTFTVSLPASVVVAAAGTASLAPGTQSPAPRSVLIADDNADGAEILAMLLQTAGHRVHVANDGAAAMELAARIRPEVAVLDIGMPGLSGYEVAKRIRREAWGRAMTLIAVTGWGQEEDKSAALAAGFDHHLTKPMDPSRLEALLATI